MLKLALNCNGHVSIAWKVSKYPSRSFVALVCYYFQYFKRQRSLINVEEDRPRRSFRVSVHRTVVSSKVRLHIGSRDTKRAICQWQTVSRSFVYINHRKFRIVGLFTRPLESMGLHFTSVSWNECPAFATRLFFRVFFARRGRRAERSGFEKDTATRRCCLLHFRTTTMLTRLRFATNANATDDHSLTSRKRCTPGSYLVFQQQEEETNPNGFSKRTKDFTTFYLIGLRSLLLPF